MLHRMKVKSVALIMYHQGLTTEADHLPSCTRRCSLTSPDSTMSLQKMPLPKQSLTFLLRQQGP